MNPAGFGADNSDPGPFKPGQGAATGPGRRARPAWLSLLALSVTSMAACAGSSPVEDGRGSPVTIVSQAPAAAGPGGDPGTAAQASDAPMIAGRLAYVGGDVQAWDSRDNAWRAARVNETIGPRSAVKTLAGGRAEILVGTTALRLNGGSDLAWQGLDFHQTEVELGQGSLIVSRRNVTAEPPAGADTGEAAGGPVSGLVQVAVQAGNVIVRMAGAGSTLLQLDDKGQRLTVQAQSGEARVEHGGRETLVMTGQRLAFGTDAGNPVALGAVADANFERWSFERDRQFDATKTYQYVSPAMTGAEALDRHGNWQVDETYGPIWYPTTVAAGWAPYRQGRWAWVEPWGWTWVDDAPWGYAPFHYGRWAYVDSRWGWVPGGWVPQPVYSPALVGYYGGGTTVTVVAGGPPGIGWFPLAPYEPWYPTYYSSPRYVTAVNGPWEGAYRRGRPPGYRYNPGGPPPRYRYADSPNAATIVPAPRFAGGRIAPGTRIPTTTGDLRRLPMPTDQPAAGRSPLFDLPSARRPTGQPVLGQPPLTQPSTQISTQPTTQSPSGLPPITRPRVSQPVNEALRQPGFGSVPPAGRNEGFAGGRPVRPDSSGFQRTLPQAIPTPTPTPAPRAIPRAQEPFSRDVRRPEPGFNRSFESLPQRAAPAPRPPPAAPVFRPPPPPSAPAMRTAPRRDDGLRIQRPGASWQGGGFERSRGGTLERGGFAAASAPSFTPAPAPGFRQARVPVDAPAFRAPPARSLSSTSQAGIWRAPSPGSLR